MTDTEKRILSDYLSSIENKITRLYRHYRLDDELLYGETLTESDLLSMTAETLLDIQRLKNTINNVL